MTDIARDLRSVAPGRTYVERTFPHSLGFGSAGIALFFAYLSRVRKEPSIAQASLDFLDDSLLALSHVTMSPSLFTGYGGIAWVHQHLEGWLWRDDEEHDSLSAVDEALLEWCEDPVASLELLDGIAGACVYASERLAKPRARSLAQRAVARLDADAEYLAAGRAWRLAGHVADIYERKGSGVPGELRSLFSDGAYKISVAHGIAGTIGAISQAIRSGLETPTSASLLTGMVEWVLAQQLSPDSSNLFPELAQTTLPQANTGWCNGDLGIAVALVAAATSVGRQDWQEQGLAIAEHEATKTIDDIEHFNRSDPTLCHGAAGRAHLFNRLFQISGRPTLESAARYWFTHLLSLRQPGAGVGGFGVQETRSPDKTGEDAGSPSGGGADTAPRAVKGFLMGSAGVGLALVAASSSVSPEWDRALLVPGA